MPLWPYLLESMLWTRSQTQPFVMSLFIKELNGSQVFEIIQGEPCMITVNLKYLHFDKIFPTNLTVYSLDLVVLWLSPPTRTCIPRGHLLSCSLIVTSTSAMAVSGTAEMLQWLPSQTRVIQSDLRNEQLTSTELSERITVPHYPLPHG